MGYELCAYCGSHHAPEEWRYCRNTLINRVYMLEKLAYIREHHFPDSTWKRRAEQIESELMDARETISLLRYALCDIAKNFDHDEQAHRTGHQDVSCRICIAEYALEFTKESKE